MQFPKVAGEGCNCYRALIILLLRQTAILLQSSECKTNYAPVAAYCLHVIPETVFVSDILIISRADTNRLKCSIVRRSVTIW